MSWLHVVNSRMWHLTCSVYETNSFFQCLLSPDVRLFLSLDNPKNAQINDDPEQLFGADEADSLVCV